MPRRRRQTAGNRQLISHSKNIKGPVAPRLALPPGTIAVTLTQHRKLQLASSDFTQEITPKMLLADSPWECYLNMYRYFRVVSLVARFIVRDATMVTPGVHVLHLSTESVNTQSFDAFSDTPGASRAKVFHNIRSRWIANEPSDLNFVEQSDVIGSVNYASTAPSEVIDAYYDFTIQMYGLNLSG